VVCNGLVGVLGGPAVYTQDWESILFPLWGSSSKTHKGVTVGNPVTYTPSRLKYSRLYLVTPGQKDKNKDQNKVRVVPKRVEKKVLNLESKISLLLNYEFPEGTLLLFKYSIRSHYYY